MNYSYYKILLTTLVCVCISLITTAQKTIPLYKGEIPNSIKGSINNKSNADGSVYQRVSAPTLSIYLPDNPNSKRAAVIICAGGGYVELNIKREGYNVAEAFNQVGVAAFVLKYRLPDDKTNQKKGIAPLQDAQQTIKMVRDSAARWNIDPNNIGIMGFSAGGHLASSAGVHYNSIIIHNANNTSLRPDFMLLVYPVISFDNTIGHIGSRDNLLGKNPSADSIIYFSNQLHVNKLTPATFLVHSADDKIVSVANSIAFFEALHKNGVAADLHIYSKGGHGFGIEPSFEEWFGRCLHWMRSNKLLNNQ